MSLITVLALLLCSEPSNCPAAAAGAEPVSPWLLSPVAYTEIARKARVTGSVEVGFELDKSGRPSRVALIKDLPMGLGQAVVDAVKRSVTTSTVGWLPQQAIKVTVDFELIKAEAAMEPGTVRVSDYHYVVRALAPKVPVYVLSYNPTTGESRCAAVDSEAAGDSAAEGGQVHGPP